MKRSGIEILFDVLEEIDNGHHKVSHLMRAANVEYIRLKPLINKLCEHGLVVEERRKKRTEYYLTEKGREALRLIRKVREAFGLNQKWEF